MKYIVLILLCLATTQRAPAQLTLSLTSYYTVVAGTTDTLKDVVVSTLPAQTTGAGQTWDFTGVVYDSTMMLNHLSVPAGPFFGSAQYGDTVMDSIASYYYYYQDQRSIDPTGLITYGAHIQNQQLWMSEAAFGGGADVNDSIYISAQDMVYPFPAPYINFNATYGSNWTDTFTSFVYGNVTVHAFGYTHTPMEFHTFHTYYDTVTGWGNIYFKNSSGAICELPALQVKSRQQYLQETYISGTLITESQHDFSGLPKDFSDGYTTYSYYVGNEVTPVVSVIMNPAASAPASAKILSKNFLPSAVPNVVGNSSISIYPNPVTDHTLTIVAPTGNGVWSYDLVNAAGQTVTTGSLQASNGTNKIKLSDKIAGGIYYLRITNNEQTVSTQKVTIE